MFIFAQTDDKSMPYSRLKTFKELIEIEKQEELAFFQKEILDTPVKERQANGYCWYPAEMVKSGFTFGEQAFVIVKRRGEMESRLSAGKIVSLSDGKDETSQKAISGTIHYVNKSKMKIILNANDLPDWIESPHLIVDMLFDEKTYKEMQIAVTKVMETKDERIKELRSVLFGLTNPYFDFAKNTIKLPQLNDSQNGAVNNVLAAQDVAIIHGPPGTGKTTTLVQSIKLTVMNERQTLVCAPSNAATDYLTLKLIEEDLNVIRLGNISRMDDGIIQSSLDGRLAKHPESKNIKKIKIKAAETRKKAKKYKRNFGSAAYKARREAFREAKDLEDWARNLETKIINEILDSAQVITCTLVGAASSLLRGFKFKTVFIDEAAQALEPMTWIPILKGEKVVLAGDPFQLPPTVKSFKAAKMNFGKTLMEHLLSIIKPINLLTTQYRMHDVIMGFSNSYFYDGALSGSVQVKAHLLYEDQLSSLEFVDTAGCDFEEVYNEKNKSRHNPSEQMMVFEHLYQLKDLWPADYEPSIGIISPYKAQVIATRNALSQDEKLKDMKVAVDTIDAFQGQERDIIYISLVRSNPKGEIGFLKDYRRMNVAMTRAKKLLVIVGDSSTIGNNKFYGEFLSYVDKEGLYRTAWEFMS